MAERKAPNRVVWPDERFKSETVPGKAGVVYAERPFDPIWGFERWGYEIHVKRGLQRFTRTDENGDPVKKKGPDGLPVVREVLCEGGKNYEYETDLHDVVILTGRGLQHIEENSPDWKLPAGLTASPPFSERGKEMLREAGLAKRYSDTFEPLPDVIRATILTECGVAPERLPYLSGHEIEAVIGRHREELGLSEQAVGDPGDLVTFDVAQRLFEVSRPTLQRTVDGGKLRSYRPANKGKHRVSVADLEKLYCLRKGAPL